MSVAAANGVHGKGHVLWMVSSGRWQRPARGVIVAHSGPLSGHERLQVELLAQPPGSAVGGPTATALGGLQGFSGLPIHILVPHSSRPRARPGVVVRRSRLLGPSDVHPVLEPRRTRLPRSVVDAASWAGSDLKAQAFIAAAVQQGLVTPERLLVCAEALLSAPRRPLILETIRDVGGGSLSEYEVLFVQLCRDFGLPTPSRQRRRRDASGRWRYLDAEFDEFDLVVEIDGQQHMDALAWWEDMMRNNELVVDENKTLLRFAGFALRHQREHVAAVLLRFIDARRVR